MKPDTRRSPRRGASQRTLLAGMVLTVAVVVTAAWFLLEGDGGARVEGGPGDVSPATPDLLGEELVPGAARSSAGADVVLLGGEGEPIPVGVRLGGVGRLEGRVLERATGDELAGVRVDLTSMPPAEVASLDRTIQGLLQLGRYAPGEYRLEVRRGSLAAVEEPVRLEQGPPVELEVRLQ